MFLSDNCFSCEASNLDDVISIAFDFGVLLTEKLDMLGRETDGLAETLEARRLLLVNRSRVSGHQGGNNTASTDGYDSNATENHDYAAADQ